MDEKRRIAEVTTGRPVAEATRVAEDLARVLAGTGRLSLDQPEVSASNGVVTLRGWVGSYSVQIAVSHPVARATRVAEEVARVLADTGHASLSQLDVSASNGVVTLRGHVGSYYQKQMAQAAALSVPGIDRLHNEVEVS